MDTQTRRTATAPLAALLLGSMALAGCTGAGSPRAESSPSASGVLGVPAGQYAEYAACMRDHGITDYPEPTDDGIDLSGTGIDPSAPAFRAASEACESLLPEGTATAPLPEAETVEGWTEVVPGGDCACSDGSEYHFWVRPADPEKVLVYFESGGACFTAELCDPALDLYSVSVGGTPPVSGAFDSGDPRNPFAGYSVIVVPYCTGDVFLGSSETTYPGGRTVQHKGFANGTAALDHLTTTFPGATDVVVAGGSAGSVAAPVYGGLVADRFPGAQVTVLADGSGSYPDLPDLNRTMADAWGTDAAMLALTGSADASWSIPGLFALTGFHHPGVVLARHDYAYDGQQARWYPLLELDTGDLLSRSDANEQRTEELGTELLSYTAPGTGHTVLEDERFYTETVEGRPFVDWVGRLISGEPVEDVRCTQCGP